MIRGSPYPFPIFDVGVGLRQTRVDRGWPAFQHLLLEVDLPTFKTIPTAVWLCFSKGSAFVTHSAEDKLLTQQKLQWRYVTSNLLCVRAIAIRARCAANFRACVIGLRAQAPLYYKPASLRVREMAGYAGLGALNGLHFSAFNLICFVFIERWYHSSFFSYSCSFSRSAVLWCNSLPNCLSPSVPRVLYFSAFHQICFALIWNVKMVYNYMEY